MNTWGLNVSRHYRSSHSCSIFCICPTDSLFCKFVKYFFFFFLFLLYITFSPETLHAIILLLLNMHRFLCAYLASVSSECLVQAFNIKVKWLPLIIWNHNPAISRRYDWQMPSMFQNESNQGLSVKGKEMKHTFLWWKYWKFTAVLQRLGYIHTARWEQLGADGQESVDFCWLL